MRILYLDIDSLRPDHLGCYGYGRGTSPTLDAVAAEGVRFNHCYCSDSPCVPSRTALFSARAGIQSGVIAHENTPAGCTFRHDRALRHLGTPTFPQALSSAGWHTASITTFSDRHGAGWFTLGFRELHVPSLKGGNEDAPEVNAVALPWLRQNAARDHWFLHVNYWDAHTLYTEPINHFERMRHEPPPAWPDEPAIARHQRDIGIRTASMLWGNHPHDGFGRSRVPTMPDAIRNTADLNHLVSGYDGAIRFLDDHLAELFDELKRQGVWDQTAIIVSADHGESFGELGQYMEHGSCSRSVHRLPLIVRWPGITDAWAGSARDDLLLHTDLLPTMLAALGIMPPSGWTGVNFLDSLRGQRSCGHTPLVWTHGLHTRQRAVFDGRWLFIRTYDPGWHVYPPRMLFDTLTDPHEQFDLAADEPDRLAELERTLVAWESEQVRRSGLPDPMRRSLPEPPKPDRAIAEVVNRLRQAGRDDDAERLLDVRRRVRKDHWPTDCCPTIMTET